jgi:hypothetical protein
MTRKEAEQAIRTEWRVWARRNNIVDADGQVALVFYGYIQQNRPDLLDFRYPGDKWQIVHGWLRHAGYVSN